MSKLIPRETVDALRQAQDVVVDMYGIECTLFIPTNLAQTQANDVFVKPSDYIYKEYPNQLVYVEWSPTVQRLQKLGIYIEGNIPLIAIFKNYPTVVLQSYFKLETRYIPNSYDGDEFEVVDVLMKGLWDAEILRVFKIAPRRIYDRPSQQGAC